MGLLRLYFGPAARDKAIQAAESLGRLVSDPVGDAGLKVDDSRAIVALAAYAGIGDRKPVVVVGPVDEATPEAADALLKTLEEMATGSLQIVLWAHHRNAVIPTILSRTHPTWCPGPPLVRWEDRDGVDELWDALAVNDSGAALCVLRDHKGSETDLLQGVVAHLEDTCENPASIKLWVRVREALEKTPVSALRAADAILEVS